MACDLMQWMVLGDDFGTVNPGVVLPPPLVGPVAMDTGPEGLSKPAQGGGNTTPKCRIKQPEKSCVWPWDPAFLYWKYINPLLY